MITEEPANSGGELPASTSESPEIHARYTWTADELLTARRLHGLHVLRRPFRYAIGLIVLLMFLIGSLSIYRLGPSFFAVTLVLVAIYIAFLRLHYRKWITRRQFQQRPDNASQVDWTFTQACVSVVSSAGSKGESSWTIFTKAVIAPEGVLLYPIDEMFHWIPRHGFDSDEMFEGFVRLVRTGVSKTHNVGNK